MSSCPEVFEEYRSSTSVRSLNLQVLTFFLEVVLFVVQISRPTSPTTEIPFFQCCVGQRRSEGDVFKLKTMNIVREKLKSLIMGAAVHYGIRIHVLEQNGSNNWTCRGFCMNFPIWNHLGGRPACVPLFQDDYQDGYLGGLSTLCWLIVGCSESWKKKEKVNCSYSCVVLACSSVLIAVSLCPMRSSCIPCCTPSSGGGSILAYTLLLLEDTQ